VARFYNKVMHLSFPFEAAKFLISCEAITSSNGSGLWCSLYAMRVFHGGENLQLVRE
jgi:hypothetical protein